MGCRCGCREELALDVEPAAVLGMDWGLEANDPYGGLSSSTTAAFSIVMTSTASSCRRMSGGPTSWLIHHNCHDMSAIGII